MDTDPDRQALDADPDLDPEKNIADPTVSGINSSGSIDSH
jgi:hypothetical protein